MKAEALRGRVAALRAALWRQVRSSLRVGGFAFGAVWGTAFGETSNGDQVAEAFGQVRVVEVSRGNYRIEPGTYVLAPGGGNGYHLVLDGLRDVEIDGQGARLVFTDPGRGGLELRNASGVTISGLTLEWENPPYLIGEVVDVDVLGASASVRPMDSAAGQWAVEHLRGAPVVWATVHGRDGRRKYSVGRRVLDVVAIVQKDGLIHLAFRRKARRELGRIAPGDGITAVGRVSEAHAIRVIEGRNVALKGLNISASPAMGILARGVAGLEISGCAVSPAGGAWIATNADGIHVFDVRGDTRIEGNRLEGLQDDAIVVSERGSWGTAVEKTAGAFWVRPVTGELPSGKAVWLWSAAVRCRASAEIRDLGEASVGTLTSCRPDAGPVALLPRSVAADVVVEGNKIVNVRGIGVRVTRSRVRVTRNTIKATTGPAIRVGTYLMRQWLPQGPSSDVVVAGNIVSQVSIRDVAGRNLRGVIEVGCWPMAACASGEIWNEGVRLRNNRVDRYWGFSRRPLAIWASTTM